MAAKPLMTVFSLEQVSRHNTKKDAYMIVHGKVYDVTSFIDEHPGGEEVMVECAGQDATEAFDDVGHSEEAWETLQGMLLGDLRSQSLSDSKKQALSGWNGKLVGAVVLGVASVAAYGAKIFL